MIVTIVNGYLTNKEVYITSKSEDFRRKYGTDIPCTTRNLYTKMVEIAKWCNNEIMEECLFEVE